MHLAPGSPLGRMCNFSATVLCAKWQRMMVTLKLEAPVTVTRGRAMTVTGSGSRFTPGGMRSGMATSDYLLLQNTLRTMWRGRWGCDTTLRHYLQMGAYHLSSLQLPQKAQTQINAYRGAWSAFVEQVMGTAGTVGPGS